MKRQRKRIVSAWLLLSIFVSMMMLSTLHRHQPIEDPATSCEACAHHVHHSGHFTTAYEHLDDCVLCHFLSLVYFAAATILVAIPVSLTIRVATSNINYLCCEVGPYDSTRAPPFIL